MTPQRINYLPMFLSLQDRREIGYFLGPYLRIDNCGISITHETMADFKYGVNTDVNIGVSVTRGGDTLFEVMGIC